MKLRKAKFFSVLLIVFSLFLTGCEVIDKVLPSKTSTQESFDLSSIPEFTDSPYVILNDNKPSFDDKDKTTNSFEEYSSLDELGRCGVAYANICQELMPTEERGSIGMVKPSGWHTVRYDDLVDGKYLYNRCHLIGFQLTGENANERNLITGTRYMNVEGMLPFENMVADYIKETNHHVLYRVTPIYEGNNLLASGVQMEAKSVEDDSIEFNVYCYNNQPGITIDYATGLSHENNSSSDTTIIIKVIANKNSKVYHSPDCGSLPAKKNQITFQSIQAAEKEGYTSHNCVH